MSRKRSISRRSVIASAAFIPVSALTSTAQAATVALSESQRQILEAFANRLVPHDEYGPSASECGSVAYIERSLSDYLAGEKPALLDGLAALDALARRTYDAPFAQLTAEKQDALLTSMETNAAAGFEPDSRSFFFRIRQLTLEGMFGDPFYGGNRAFAGWDLIRYPGPRLAVSAEEQKIKVEIKPVRVSARGGDHNH